MASRARGRSRSMCDASQSPAEVEIDRPPRHASSRSRGRISGDSGDQGMGPQRSTEKHAMRSACILVDEHTVESERVGFSEGGMQREDVREERVFERYAPKEGATCYRRPSPTETPLGNRAMLNTAGTVCAGLCLWLRTNRIIPSILPIVRGLINNNYYSHY